MNDFNQQSESPEHPKRQHITKSSASLWSSLLAIVIAIIAIATAFYSYEQYQHIKNNNDTNNSNNATQLQLAQSHIKQLQTNLLATQQNVAQLMQHLGNSQQQATLSQVAYLVNLANLQLNVSHNTQSSLRMLTLAQTKIDSLNDPRLFPLEKILARDITALKAVPKFNMAQIVSEIDMLSDQVGAATLMPNKKDLNKAEKKSEHDAAKPDTKQTDKWYNRAWHHLSGIKDLIIIRKNDPNIKPLLDTEQQVLIKSTIQSKLLLAEYAAIQHNNTLYQKHLAAVKKWIETYFFDSIDRENLLAQLKTLQNINVSPTIPDINDTITVLNQTLNNTLTNSTSNTTTPKKTIPTLPNKKQPKEPSILPETSTNAGVAI